MANNSLDDLLKWMGEDTRLLNWGLVVALERYKANLLIIQEYIRRFGVGDDLPLVNGSVPIVDNEYVEYVHDFLMAIPSLSFENADLNDSKAMLTMAVMGGSHITLKKDSAGWKPRLLSEIDPLVGPKLYLDLLLNQVPGDVAIDGQVKLDLSKSDNFRVAIGATDHVERLLGEFFRNFFNKLPDEKRIYPLGKIQPGTNELMRPQSFELRTQARKAFAGDEAGAVLVLIRTMSRNGGNFPGSSYKYLIPDDEGKDYSATVLFDRRRVAGVALLREMLRLLGPQGAFDYIYDEGELSKAIARGGKITIPKFQFQQTIPIKYKDYPEDLVPFDITFPERDIWVAEEDCKFEIDFTENLLAICFEVVAIVKNVLFLAFGTLPLHQDVEITLAVSVEYELVEEAGQIMLKQVKYDGGGRAKIFAEGVGAPSAIDSELKAALEKVSGKNSGWLPTTPEEWAIWWGIINAFLEAMIPEHVNAAIEPKLREAFKEQIETTFVANSTIKEIIEFNFGQAIQGDEIYMPGVGDVGFFGRMNPGPTTFAITQMQPVLLHSAKLAFTTNKPVSNLEWRVENLVASTSSPGKINKDTGYYEAPPAASIEGRFTRVRVTATAPSGYYSSALVTVVVNALTVDPLIQICGLNSSVELRAGQLGTDTLNWSIKNPVAGESGKVLPSVEPDGDHTYHHGGNVDEKTYILDEIEVSTSTGEKRSVHVLALMQDPLLTVNIINMDVATGQVQLEAIVNKKVVPAEWSLPLKGPGSIDANGLYRMAQTATERYALIFASVDAGPLGKFEGYLILPLPLIEFSNLYEVLKQ